MFIPNNYKFTIFFAIFSQESQKNLMWKVVTNSNLNSPLKLFFYSPILANNNLLLKIYCENIVVVFLNCHFLFSILFFFSISSTRFFFPLVFSPPHTYTHSSSLLYLFLLDSRSLFSALSLSLSFLFLLDSRTFSSSLCDNK